MWSFSVGNDRNWQSFVMSPIFIIIILMLPPWIVEGDEQVLAGRKPKTTSQKLYDELFKDYNADLRPTRNDSVPINVSMHLWFKQVLKVDEIDQILTIYCWTETYWVDELLQWNPDDFDGITTLRVPSQRIWRPDILVYNNADMNINENEISTNAVLNYTGHITNFRAIITKVTCNLEMTYFPFDQQKCNMMFASWSYDGSKVWIEPARDKQSNLEYYIENTEWKLLNFSYKPNVNYYDCCPEPYPDITYTFVLERNPSYYILNLIIPSVFITVVTMVGFFTPYSSTGENTEKVSLGVTALLSLAIILLMVADKMPATSKVIPLIGKYYIGLIWLIFAATIITTVTLRLQSKGNAGKPLSSETKRLFFHYIARLLFMKVDLPPKSFAAPSSPSTPTTPANNHYPPHPNPPQHPTSTTIDPRPVVSNGGVVTETAFLAKDERVANSSSVGLESGLAEGGRHQHIFQRSASHHSLLSTTAVNDDEEHPPPGGAVEAGHVGCVGSDTAAITSNCGGRRFQHQQEKLSNASSLVFGLNHGNKSTLGPLHKAQAHHQPSSSQTRHPNRDHPSFCPHHNVDFVAQKTLCCPHQSFHPAPEHHRKPAGFGQEEKVAASSDSVELVRQVSRLRLIVRAIDNKLEAEQEMSGVRKEWEQLSRVCERMLMIIFVFITVLFAVLMLHSPGQGSKPAANAVIAPPPA